MSKQQGTSRVVGRVVDQAGNPVGDAVVRAEPGAHTTTTHADGTFTLERLQDRTYSVSARKDRCYAWPTIVDAAEAPGAVTLCLRLGATLVVRVIGDRAPVAGATLTLEHGFTAVTDAMGRAEVAGLAPIHHRGRLLADGWADEHFTVFLHEDPGGVVERVVQLERGARIEGLVLDAAGSPVEEAIVRAVEVKRHRSVSTWPDPDGTWRLNVAAGTYALLAQAREHDGSVPLMLSSDGRAAHRDVVLRLGAPRPNGMRQRTIAGVVVDEHGEPASEADVRVVGSSFAVGGARADSNGRFEIENLEPGDFEIVASWVAPWLGQRKHAVRQGVPSGDTNVKLVLPRGPTVRGQVMRDGRPVTYFGLRLVGERESPAGSTPIGVSTDDGRFALGHVSPGTWRLAVLAPGTRFAVSKEFTVTDDAVDLGEIVVTRGQQLRGHVRDEAGAAVAGARVIIGRMSSWAAERSMLERMFLGQYETTTDGAGAYAFDGIDIDHNTMRSAEIVQATHHARGASLIREVPSADATMDFVLQRTGRIEGVVENMRGGPALVVAERAEEPRSSRHASCDKEGRFRFDEVPQGSYVLRVDAPQIEPVGVTVTANETASVALVMTGSVVELRLQVPLGRGNQLVIEPASEGAAIRGRVRGVMTIGTEEYCHFKYVEPGTYRISFDGQHWGSIIVEASPAEQHFDVRGLIDT